MSQSTASQMKKNSEQFQLLPHHSDKWGTALNPETSKSKNREPSFDVFKKSDIKNNALLDSLLSERTSKIKFRDDQSVMEGKPVTPPSKKLASPNRIIRQENESLADKISQIYNKEGILEFKQMLPDGFYALPFVESTGSQSLPKVVLDQNNDPELHNLLVTAQNLCSSIPNSYQRVKTLALFVSDTFGGRVRIHSSSTLSLFSLYENYHNELSTKSKASLLYLGKLQFGLTHERSLLFQYLAVRLSIISKLITITCSQTSTPQQTELNPSKAYEQYHSYNVVCFENSKETFVVDLFFNPGHLYPELSPLAMQYTKPFNQLSCSELSHVFQQLNLSHFSNESELSTRCFPAPNFCLSEPEIIEEIGSGKTAKVYRVKLHGFICALKIVKTEGMTDDMKQSLRREVELMSRLNHRYIVTLFGHEEKKKEFHIYMELMSTSLQQHLIEMRNGKKATFTLSQALQIAIAVAEALQYLHTLSDKVMHRDIKSKNVLLEVNSEGQVINTKLCDFSVATTIRPSKKYRDPVGTARWMAPECHLMESYNEKVDIWSFGMLLVELTTLQLPYCETEFLDVKKRIVKGEIPNLSYILPHLQPLKEIIFKCLRFSPQERPTASELVKQLNEIKSTIQ